MLKKTIKYEDFMENEREETFYFNMTESELMFFNKTFGDINTKLNKAIDKEDMAELLKVVSDIILFSYGNPSDDGRRFVKSNEAREEFEQSAAYQALLMEIATDDNAASSFMMGVMPKKFRNQVSEEMAKAKN